jgi:ABC-type sugar transport system ATPase subunit
VLRDGRVEQAGRPADLYDRPANRFVAGFLGSPPMTLVEGRVENGVVRAGRVALPLPPGAHAAEGELVLAGVRPERVRLDGSGFPARVELVELAGHEEVCHLTAGAVRLVARTARGLAPPAGSKVSVAVDAEAICLFDPITGEAR